MRNQNFRADLQQTKPSNTNRLEWGVHNPNLKMPHLIRTKKISNQNQWLADIEYEDSLREQREFIG